MKRAVFLSRWFQFLVLREPNHAEFVSIGRNNIGKFDIKKFHRESWSQSSKTLLNKFLRYSKCLSYTSPRQFGFRMEGEFCVMQYLKDL